MTETRAGVRLMTVKDVSFGIRLEADLARVLEDAARESGRSRNELVTEALRQVYGPRMGLNALQEQALAVADRAVRDRLAVVETAIRQVLDRISAIESTMKDVQDEVLTLETDKELDPIERSRRRTALREDLNALTEALEGEKKVLEDLRAQRKRLLAERAEVYAKNLRPALEAWLAQEGARVSAVVGDFLLGWLSGLDSCLYLRTPADRARAVRFLWYGILNEVSRTANDVGIQSWARQMLPLTNWDWRKTADLTFKDFPVRQHGEVVHATHDGHGGEEGGHEEGY